MVTQWEAIAEAGITDDQLIKFADACGMTGVDMPEFVTILGAYCGRKALRGDLWDGTFLDAPIAGVELCQPGHRRDSTAIAKNPG